MEQGSANGSLTWLEVDLRAITQNLRVIRGKVGPNRHVLAVLKANAYGHGILPVAKACAKAGVEFLGVGSAHEGLLLRDHGINNSILLLSPILERDILPVVRSSLTPTVSSLRAAKLVSTEAIRQRKTIRVHAEVDTGMGRFGFDLPTAARNIGFIHRMPGISLEGIWTHLANASDERFTNIQLGLFRRIVYELEVLGVRIPIKHVAASTAILKWPSTYFDMVRPGLILYGLCPLGISRTHSLGLSPAMSLKAKILFLKQVPRGTTVSYGSTFRASRRSKVAVLPVGFADGYCRALSNRSTVLVKGIKAPVIGNICMGQTMIDVTKVPDVRVGQDAILLNASNRLGTTINDVALRLNSIPNEVACGLSERIPRIYVNG